MRWNEIEQSERWKTLTPDQRRAARERYFDEFVAPNAPETFDSAELRTKWMAYSDRDEAARQPGSVGPRSRGGERNPMTAEDALVSQAQNAVGRGVPVAEVKDRIRDMDAFAKGDRPFDDMSARARSPRGGKPMGYVSSQREIDEATIPADELMRRDQSKYEAETTFGDRLRNRVDQGFAQAETGLASLPMNAAVDRLQELERTGDVVLSWRNDMPQYASDVFKGDAWEDFKRRTREEAQGATADFAASTAMRNRYTASLPQSPARQYAQKSGDWKGGFLADPLGYSADAAVPSAVAMAPALAVAGVARNPVAGAAIMGLTGFTNERAGSMVEYLAEQGIDTSNEDAIRKALSNPEIFNAADKYATTRAAIIAPIDAIGAGLASRTIAPGVRGFLRREAVNTLVGQPVTQAAIGGAGEAAAGLATKGRISGVDVFDEVLGEVAMSHAETAPYAIDRVRNGGSDVIGNMGNDSLRDVANNANATRGERMSALMELAARGDTADVRPDTPVGRGAAAAESILKATKPAVAPMPTGANIGLAVPPSSSAPDDDAKLGQLLAGRNLESARKQFDEDAALAKAQRGGVIDPAEADAIAQRAADAYGVDVNELLGRPSTPARPENPNFGNANPNFGSYEPDLTAEAYDRARRDIRRSEAMQRAESGVPVEQQVPQQPQVTLTQAPDSLRSRRDAGRARNDFDAYLQESGQTDDDLAAASAYDGDRIPQPSSEPVTVGPSRIAGQGIIATAPVSKPVTLFDMNADGPVRTDAGRYINHSPSPNADPRIVQGRIVAVPNRPIQAGEELTIDYRAIDPLREELATRQHVPEPTPRPDPGLRQMAAADPDKNPEQFGLPKPMLPRGKKRKPSDFDENYDDALDLIALSGGLSREAWKYEGVDPDMLTRKKGNEWNKRFGATGPTLFPAKGGMTPDQVREMLQQRGFFAQDVDGDVTEANDAINLVMESINQGRVYRTPKGAEVAQRSESLRRASDDAARDLSVVRELGLNDDDIIEANEFDNRERVQFSQAPATDTTEFRKWFGDSKVVDADGKPLVVYHGTNQNITAFDPARIGLRDAGFFGSGFYSTPDEGFAQDYADTAVEDTGEGEAAAMPLYVSLQNPFIWDMSDEGADATRAALAAAGIKRTSVRGNSAALGNAKEREIFNRAVREQGYDGVIVRDEYGIQEVVAFRPEQIKSVNNRGTWDKNDARILFSQSEGIESDEISQDEFDAIMREQRGRMSERENDRLVSLAPDEFTRGVWERLSEIPELAQNPKIAGSTPSEVVAAAKMGAELTGITSGSDESGPHQVHYFKLPDRIVERDGRRVTDKGGTFAVKVYKNAVEVNVSDLKPGESGSRIYNAVAGLADTTGKLFRGDTQGLSDWAILRRTENMVSNALKYGVDTVAPHPRQTSPGGKMSWAAPLKWTPDGKKNLSNLLLTSAENVARLLPELDNYTYNWQAKRFEDANGNAVNADALDRLSVRAGRAFDAKVGREPGDAGRPRSEMAGVGTQDLAPNSPFGRNSIARAILTRSLVRSAGSEGRGAVLANSGAQRAELSLDDALRGLLYSQSDAKRSGVRKAKGDGLDGVRSSDTSADRKTPSPSGIPRGLDSKPSLATNKLSNVISKFLGKPYRAEQVVLPDAVSGPLQDFGRLFGRSVVVFRTKDGRLNANGLVLGDGSIYVNENAQSPALTIASHELLHEIRQSRPDLYDFIRKEVEQRADFAKWKAEIDSRELTKGENRLSDDKVMEELVADSFGDALTDPEFLAALAKRNPSKFRQFVMSALDFFRDIAKKMGKVKSLGSHEYLRDVEGLRDAYAQMLDDFTNGVMPTESDGIVQFQAAWHGTPHTVDRFSMQKIGTGEGAQAYGWGLYFAGKREVAEYYRNKLTEATSPISSMTVRGQKIDPFSPEGHGARLVFHNGKQEMKSLAKQMLSDARKGDPYTIETANKAGMGAVEYYQRVSDTIASVKKSDVKINRGNLYRVDIPDDSDLLDYDAAIADQPKPAQELARAFLRQHGYLRENENGPRQLSSSFREAKRELAGMSPPPDGGALYDMIAKKLGGEQAASQYLNEHGIPGLRYKAGQIAGVKGGGHNYVIWDEAAIGEPQAQFSQAAGGDSVGGMQEDDYRGEHGAPMSDSGAPAHDVTGGGNYYPDDVYSANGMRYYGDGSAHDAESFSIIRRLKGRPNADVKIYRAVPKVKTKADLIADVDAEMARIQRRGGTPGRYDWLSDERDRLLRLPDDAPAKKIGINRGDWVSITSGYAVDHGRGALGGEYRIVSKTVKARDIFTNGDSIHEWGYDPQDGTSRNSDTDPQFSQPSTDITTTPEFERWFGESKVVDADGKPLVVYHGSSRDIESFAAGADEAGQSNGNRTGAWGSYFTPSAAEASIYAEMAGGDSPQNVVPVYLAIRNPYVMNRAEWGKHSQRTAKAATSAEGRADAKAVRAGIEALGHDGIVIRDRGFNDEWVAFRPEQIKSVNNRGTFDPNDPRILFSQPKTPAQAAAENAQKRATVATATGAQQPVTFTYTDRFEGQIRGRLNRLREGAQDKMLSALFVQEDIEAARGAIADAVNVYRRENLMHGRTGDQLETLKRTHVDPLVKAMKAEGLDDAVVEDYLEAKFAPERNKIIAAKNPNMPDGGSGMTDAEAADFLAGKTDGFRSGRKITPADTAKLQRIATKIQALRAETLDRLESSGLINAQAKAAMLAQAPNYVPLRGKDGAEIGSGRGGAGKGIDVRGSSIKEALGRGAGNRAVNILAEMIADAERSIVQAEKNRVGKTLARLVLENPNPDLWEVEPVRLEQKLDSVGQVYQAVQSNAQDQDAIRIMHDGKPYFVRLSDPKLRDAMKNLGVDNSGAVIKFMGGINRYFSAVLTRYNPSFIVVNALRDLGFGMTGIAAEHGVKVAGSAAAKYPAAMRAMWRDNRGTLKNTAMDRYAREFSEAGGKTFFAKRDSVEEISSRVAAEFKSYGKLLRRGQVGLAWNKAVNNSALLKVVNDANDAVENAMRLSAYAALRESGKSVEQAAEYAKNITVNFNRKGQVATAANAVILFYNAATQGAHRSIKLLRNPKVMAAMGGLAGLQALLAAYAMGSDDEDEDGLTAWEKIPPYEKERNLIIPIVGVDANGNRRIRMVKWPMPYGFNVFSYAGGRMAELAVTKEPKPAKFANDMGNAVVNAFSPVKFIDGMDGIKPHFMKIFDALKANEDDLGMPIRVSDDFDKFPKPRAYSGKADTPEAYKAVAKALNILGGGDEVTPPKVFAGLLDFAPEDLEYLTEQLTGGLGRFASDSYGVGEKLFAGIDTKPTDYPVLRSLVGEVDQNRATQGAYREREDEIEREVERVRRTIYAGREKVGEGRYTLDVEAKKKADDLMRNTPELDGYQIRRLKNGSIFDKSGAVEFEAKRGLAKSYKDAKKEVDRIKAEIRAAQAQTFPSLKAKSDRIKELQAQREKAQREFNEAFAKRER